MRASRVNDYGRGLGESEAQYRVGVSAALVLRTGSPLLEDLLRAACDDRCVFLAGLPGVGKRCSCSNLPCWGTT
jgi:hypothetical protein